MWLQPLGTVPSLSGCLSKEPQGWDNSTEHLNASSLRRISIILYLRRSA